MTARPEEVIEEPEAELAGEPATPERRLVTLGDGRVVAPARDREVFYAWAVDAFVVFSTTLAVYVILATAFPDPFSFARELNAVAAWPAVAFAYGLTASNRRSLGQRMAGTRTFRIDNGGRLGFWRAGWMMVLRVVLFPAVVAFCFLGGGTFGIKDRHISVDVLATGL